MYVYIYMYVCVCMYMYVYMYACMYTYVCMSVFFQERVVGANSGSLHPNDTRRERSRLLTLAQTSHTITLYLWPPPCQLFYWQQTPLLSAPESCSSQGANVSVQRCVLRSHFDDSITHYRDEKRLSRAQLRFWGYSTCELWDAEWEETEREWPKMARQST